MYYGLVVVTPCQRPPPRPQTLHHSRDNLTILNGLLPYVYICRLIYVRGYMYYGLVVVTPCQRPPPRPQTLHHSRDNLTILN